MAKLCLLHLLLLFLSFHYMPHITESAGASNFIKASCRATLYPVLCVQCLSGYANKIQQNERALVQAALSVSLARAQYATMFVSKMSKAAGMKAREYQAVKDCIDNMVDTIDQLSRSIRELNQMGRARNQDFMWHVSNVQTWVSAALTDENTCVDGFSGRFMEGDTKAAVKKRMVTVAQVTSNALALVNRFAARPRGAAAAAMNMP